MEKYDLSVHRGETFAQVLLFKDEGGVLMDLSGCSCAAQVRPEPGSDELTAEMGAAITAAEGKVVLTIAAPVTGTIEPGSYAYDFVMTDAGNVTRYMIGGRFTVLPSVTVTGGGE